MQPCLAVNASQTDVAFVLEIKMTNRFRSESCYSFRFGFPPSVLCLKNGLLLNNSLRGSVIKIGPHSIPVSGLYENLRPQVYPAITEWCLCEVCPSEETQQAKC
ncbi:unnamed protein product [Ceratitis capitata]|uniref:(Mediterranean fruit fly) hypothetical protein n=1 Tax=Ceratitis capitata TaxID=7213 RepID=A0A811UKX6_CERCA|nr:unnamed protein product [Ceratitis capitata]